MNPDDKWICVRPERHHCPLEFSLMRSALTTPCLPTKFVREIAVRRDPAGSLWFTGLPPRDQLATSFVSENEIFERCIALRITDFQTIVEISDYLFDWCLKSSKPLQEWIGVLDKVTECYQLFFKHVNLGLLDENVLQYAESILCLDHPRQVVQLLLATLLRSDYSRIALQTGMAMPKNTDFRLEPKRMIRAVRGTISKTIGVNMFPVANEVHLQEILEQHRDMLEAASMAYQFGQQNYFVGAPLRLTVGSVLGELGSILKKTGKLRERDDLKELEITDVRAKLYAI